MNADDRDTALCVYSRLSAVKLAEQELIGRTSYYVNRRLQFLSNRTRGGCLKATGQIQNPEDFFEAGIAEVPPKNCLLSGLDHGICSPTESAWARAASDLGTISGTFLLLLVRGVHADYLLALAKDLS
jgi:hypothetical protein